MAAGVDTVAVPAILAGGALTVAEPLVRYRRGGSSKWPSIGAGRHLVDWVRVQNRRVLAEIEQFTRDATLAGHGAEVAAALAPVLARERYMERVVTAADTGTRGTRPAARLALAQVPHLHLPRARGGDQALAPKRSPCLSTHRRPRRWRRSC